MDGEKQCPFCAETIRAQAIRCKHCNTNLNKTSSKPNKKLDSVLERTEKIASWIRLFIAGSFILFGGIGFLFYSGSLSATVGLPLMIVGVIILPQFDKLTDKFLKRKFSSSLKLTLIIFIFICSVLFF